MGVHPKLQELIDNSSKKPLEEQSLEEIRRGAMQLTPLAGDPKEVYKLQSKAIHGDGYDILTRIYYPNNKKNLPMILYFHPGGFVRGDIDSCDPICRNLCNESKYIVISVNYRLAPEDPFPAPLEDGYLVLNWIHENAEEIGGDPDKIAVVGESSGGNLATVLCMMTRDKGGPKVSFQGLIYPQLDYTNSYPSHQKFSEGCFLQEKVIKFYAKQYVPEDIDLKHPYLSPVFAKDLTGLPPSYVISAEYDPLRDEAEDYVVKLRKAGNKVVSHRFKGMIHGFFGMAMLVSEAKLAMSSLVDALHVIFQNKNNIRKSA